MYRDHGWAVYRWLVDPVGRVVDSTMFRVDQAMVGGSAPAGEVKVADLGLCPVLGVI
jgi:hypothetical protein